MNPLHRTPVFVALLAVLAAGGGTAGWTLGHRTPPNAVKEYNDDCQLLPDAPAALLLPPGSFISHSSTHYRSVPTTGRAPFRETCRMATPHAAVIFSTRTLHGGTPAQWRKAFADTGHLRLADAVHLNANGGTLVWPKAAFSHTTCPGTDKLSIAIEVHLTGDAGKGTPHRDTVMGEIVSRLAARNLYLDCP